jgi:hypothetical protein
MQVRTVRFAEGQDNIPDDQKTFLVDYTDDVIDDVYLSEIVSFCTSWGVYGKDDIGDVTLDDLVDMQLFLFDKKNELLDIKKRYRIQDGNTPFKSISYATDVMLLYGDVSMQSRELTYNILKRDIISTLNVIKMCYNILEKVIEDVTRLEYQNTSKIA